MNAIIILSDAKDVSQVFSINILMLNHFFLGKPLLEKFRALDTAGHRYSKIYLEFRRTFKIYLDIVIKVYLDTGMYL